MEQDLLVVVALLAHDGGPNLAEADAVAPAATVKEEMIAVLFDVEG